MEKKKSYLLMFASIILITIICFVTYGYFTKPKSANPDETIFGKQEEEIAKIYGWNLNNAERTEIPSEALSMQSGNLSGYTIKLQNVTLFGKTAQQVYLQFMGSDSVSTGLTLLYAEYSVDEKMEEVAEELTKIWGESKAKMYCSWPDRIYLEDIWAGNSAFDSPDSFSQSASDEKQLWGSKLTIGDSLKEHENPEEIYEDWSQKYSRIYVQSMKNDWEEIAEEPLVTAVLFGNSEEYDKENTIILDGFNLFVSQH